MAVNPVMTRTAAVSQVLHLVRSALAAQLQVVRIATEFQASVKIDFASAVCDLVTYRRVLPQLRVGDTFLAADARDGLAGAGDIGTTLDHFKFLPE